MFKKRTNVPYWNEFAKYQSFKSAEEVFHAVVVIENTYILPDSIKSVLNTLKLHSQTFFGASWLKISEIADKAKVSISSVKRAIRLLKENGIIQVIPQTHTVTGSDAPNVYVINNPSSFVSEPIDESVDEPVDDPVTEPVDEPPYSNSNKDFDINPDSDPKNNKKEFKKNFDKFDKKVDSVWIDFDEEDKKIILKSVPKEFVEIMLPYYSNSPDIILKRWKSTCIAIKRNYFSFNDNHWQIIRQAWKTTVNMYKRNLIDNVKKKGTDVNDALGGYYYGLLCDFLIQARLQEQVA